MMNDTQKLDSLFSKYVRLRDKFCRRCYTRDQLECSHIVGRANLAGRWHHMNAIALCRDCHRWWHHNPNDASDWLKEKYPLLYAESQVLKTIISHNIDYERLRKDLQSSVDELLRKY